MKGLSDQAARAVAFAVTLAAYAVAPSAGYAQQPTGQGVVCVYNASGIIPSSRQDEIFKKGWQSTLIATVLAGGTAAALLHKLGLSDAASDSAMAGELADQPAEAIVEFIEESAPVAEAGGEAAGLALVLEAALGNLLTAYFTTGELLPAAYVARTSIRAQGQNGSWAHQAVGDKTCKQYPIGTNVQVWNQMQRAGWRSTCHSWVKADKVPVVVMMGGTWVNPTCSWAGLNDPS